MNTGKNLIGIKFGKVTVQSKAESILGGNKVKRYWGAWNCSCECGNNIIVKTVHLLRGQVKSCGCINKNGRSIKPGDKYNKLTALTYKKGSKWLCQCDCGEIVEVNTESIINGNTKSCGCLKSEVSSKKSNNLIEGRRKNDPRIASARRVWQSYCYNDKMCEIDFDNFYKLSQQDCYYCGVKPSREYNYFLTKSANSSEKAKEEGLFIYNGIDRIDSNKYYTIENVVSCCNNCNRCKNNRSVSDFLIWAHNIRESGDNIIIDSREIPKGSLGTSIKCVFYNYKKDTDLKIEEFYSISQMSCYYCGSLPNNVFNRAKIDKKASKKAKLEGDYIYNGLDRIDSNLGHIRGNVVPCCKYCNFGKSKLSVVEFYSWANRVREYQKKESGKNPDSF